MAAAPRPQGSPEGRGDASRAIALFLTIALVAIFGVVMMIQLVEVMPFGMWLLTAVCLSVAVLASAWAVFSRVYSTPSGYQPGPPVLKPRRVKPIRSSNGHHPHRPGDAPGGKDAP